MVFAHKNLIQGFIEWNEASLIKGLSWWEDYKILHLCIRRQSCHAAQIPRHILNKISADLNINLGVPENQSIH